MPPVMVWTKVESTPTTALTVDALKTWLNRPLEDPFWDRESTGLVLVATRAIEQWCSISIAPTTWLGTTSEFATRMTVVRRPFSAVEKIEYVDPVSGQIATVDPTTYQTAPVAQLCGQIWCGEAASWPDTARRVDAVRLTVKTGWQSVPEDIMHAIMMTVASLDINRGDDGSSSQGKLANTVWGQSNSRPPSIIPAGAQALLAPYRYLQVMAA